MKVYTKAEYEILLNQSLKKLQDFSDNVEQKYTSFLKSLSDKDYDSLSKNRIAKDHCDSAVDEIYNFIDKTYPNGEEVFLNGLITYTIETGIRVKCLLKVPQTRKKFDNLFQQFSENLQNPYNTL